MIVAAVRDLLAFEISNPLQHIKSKTTCRPAGLAKKTFITRTWIYRYVKANYINDKNHDDMKLKKLILRALKNGCKNEVLVGKKIIGGKSHMKNNMSYKLGPKADTQNSPHSDGQDGQGKVKSLGGKSPQPEDAAEVDGAKKSIKLKSLHSLVGGNSNGQKAQPAKPMPKSPFERFKTEQMGHLQERYIGIGDEDLEQMVVDEWNDLSEDQKQPYQVRIEKFVCTSRQTSHFFGIPASNLEHV